MIAVKEITKWNVEHAQPNHTYLLDGMNMLAYIKNEESTPFYFKNPIRFNKRGRSFTELKVNPFTLKVASTTIRVEGSRGAVYEVDPAAKTCTCPGFTFRGSCKHVKELA